MAETCSDLPESASNNLKFHRLLPHEVSTGSSPSHCSSGSSSNLHNRAQPCNSATASLSNQSSKVARYGDQQDIAAASVGHIYDSNYSLISHEHLMSVQAAAAMAASAEHMQASAAASAQFMNMISSNACNQSGRKGFLFNGLMSAPATPLIYPRLSSHSNGSQYNNRMLHQQYNTGSSLFTAEQWLEFTQQTLIFKHMAVGISPPADLVLPIIRSVQTARLIGLGLIANGINSPALLHHLNVGGFYSLRGNVDPEPGRCRRTDGKKWRCSKDVVPDQKYCERHIHRGRHRSKAKKQQLLNQQQQQLNAISSTDNTSLIEQPAQLQVNRINGSNASASKFDETCSTDTCSVSAKHINSESNRSCSNIDQVQMTAPTSCYNTDLRRQLLIAQSQRNTNISTVSSDHSLIKRNNNADQHQTSSSDYMLKVQHSASYQSSKFSLSWPNMGNGLSLEAEDHHQYQQLSSIQTNIDSRFDHNQRSNENILSLSMAARSNSCGSDAELATINSRHDQIVTHNIDHDQNVSKPPFINWVPISWDNNNNNIDNTTTSNTIGGPLAEAFQSTIRSTGIRNLDLPSTEAELDIVDAEYRSRSAENDLGSWIHQHHQQHSSFSCPQSDAAQHHPSKKHHNSVTNLASPTGVLQIKAAFGSCASESSSTASSPRSAIKLLDSSSVISLHSAHHFLPKDENNKTHNI